MLNRVIAIIENIKISLKIFCSEAKFCCRCRPVAQYFIKTHCMKSVRIPTYSGPYFPVFGLKTRTEYFLLDVVSLTHLEKLL